MLAGEEFQGFGDLDGGGEVDGGREDAGGVAGFHGTGGGLWEEAGEAGGGLPEIAPVGAKRQDVHGGGVGANGCGIDPGDGVLDGEVVEEVAGFEVIGGVEDEVGAGKQVVDVCGDEVGDMGQDVDVAVEELDLAACGFGFGEGVEGVLLVKEDLALEVGGFDEVAVDERKGPDAGAGEQRGRGCAGGADADDGDPAGGEAFLTGATDSREEDLPGVAIGGVDGTERGRRSREAFLSRQRCVVGATFVRPWSL